MNTTIQLQQQDDTIPNETKAVKLDDEHVSAKLLAQRQYHREYKRKQRELNPDGARKYNRALKARKMLSADELNLYNNHNVDVHHMADVACALKYLRKMQPSVQQAVFALLSDTV